MKTLLYVDSPSAAGLAFTVANAEDIVATDASPLAALPAMSGRVLDLDRSIDQALANKIGVAAISIALAIDEIVAGSAFVSKVGLVAPHARLGGGMSRLAGGLLHRAAAMAAFLKRWSPQTVRLLTVPGPFADPKHPSIPTRFGSPFRPLADLGFFGARQVLVEDVSVTDQGIQEVANATGLRRYVHLPSSLIAYEILERLRLFRLLPAPRGRIVVGKENETLREALPYLTARGFGLKRVGRVFDVGQSPRHPNDAEFQEVSGLVDQVIEKLIDQLGLFSAHEREALVGVLSRQVAAALVAMADEIPRWRERVRDLFSDITGPKVYLTNGLFGLQGAQLYGLLQEAGVSVVDVEHGVTTGLSEHSQRKIRFSEAASADLTLVCSPNAAHAFRAARVDGTVDARSVGLASQTRSLIRRRLQRPLARRSLGLKARDVVVMHVSTWVPSGNMRPGYGTPTEHAVVDLDVTLVQDVYAKLDKRVIYKPYPTRRFPDEPLLQERMILSANLGISLREDLRYIRAAADILVTMSPTSTLGWVLGTGKPVIWLGSAILNPLCAGFDDRFKASFITIDIDHKGWVDQLRDSLSRSLADITQDWLNRAEARDALLRDAFDVPDAVAGVRLAGIVSELFHQSKQKGQVSA